MVSVYRGAPVNWEERIAGNNVRAISSGDGLIMLSYTHECQYKPPSEWTELERCSRGHVYTEQTGTWVARPFDKFWECPIDQVSPDLTFYEKADGSLGIVFYDYVNEYWRATTRGSFNSDQAQWAQERIRDIDFDPAYTYLFEIIYPANRVVVDYGSREALILLACRHIDTGKYMQAQHFRDEAERLAYPIPEQYTYTEMVQAYVMRGIEGFVCVSPRGERWKIKTEWYKAAHRLIGGLNMRRIVEAMQRGEYETILAEVPEHLKPLFNSYSHQAQDAIAELQQRVWNAMVDWKHVPGTKDRKAFAAFVMSQHKDISALLFKYYDGVDITNEVYRRVAGMGYKTE